MTISTMIWRLSRWVRRLWVEGTYRGVPVLPGVALRASAVLCELSYAMSPSLLPWNVVRAHRARQRGIQKGRERLASYSEASPEVLGVYLELVEQAAERTRERLERSLRCHGCDMGFSLKGAAPRPAYENGGCVGYVCERCV